MTCKSHDEKEKNLSKKRKDIALKFKENYSSKSLRDDNDDMIFLTKKFKKFMRKKQDIETLQKWVSIIEKEVIKLKEEESTQNNMWWIKWVKNERVNQWRRSGKLCLNSFQW